LFFLSALNQSLRPIGVELYILGEIIDLTDIKRVINGRLLFALTQSGISFSYPL